MRVAAAAVVALLCWAPMSNAERDAPIVGAARSAIGSPYRWAASGPDAFDCSGLVAWAYAQAGIDVPRVSQAQASAGQPVDRDALEPGDIVTYYPDASHVAIYSGDGQVIHASTYGRPVTEVPVDQAGPFHNARRYPRRKRTVTLYYPDVSNNNWHTSGEAVNFCSQLADEGFSAVCHKVTEGDYYRDPFWSSVLAWAQDTDTPCIGYHYVTTDAAEAQVENYLDHVENPDVPCMLDFEDNSGDLDNYWRVVRAFNDAGIKIALSYIPHWYWTQIGRPDLSQVPGLVSSSYPAGGGYASTIYAASDGSNGPGWVSYGGATPVVWQFTSQARIGGHDVDCNAFEGSLNEFKRLLGVETSKSETVKLPDSLTDRQVLDDIWRQLRGPAGQGWPQLGTNDDGEKLSLVDAIAQLRKDTNNG